MLILFAIGIPVSLAILYFFGLFKLFSVLLMATGLFYLMGFWLRVVDSPWLAKKMPAFFPLLAHRFPDKVSQLIQLLIWAIVLPAVSVLLWRGHWHALGVVTALSAWEVYLGATFYFQINDAPGGKVHMILHAFIVGVTAVAIGAKQFGLH